MALARTNRGTANLAYGSNTNAAVSSASFSPAAGSLLLALIVMMRTGGDASFTMSSTFTGQGAWTKVTTSDNDGGNWYHTCIAYSVCGGSPGTGTVTATDSGSASSAVFMEVIEVTGQAASPIAQSVTNFGSASSLALNLGSAPAASSYLFTTIIDDTFGGGSPTVPTGFTALGTDTWGIDAGGWNGEDLGSGAQNNSWTTLNTYKHAGALVEVAEAATPTDLDVPLLRRFPRSMSASPLYRI